MDKYEEVILHPFLQNNEWKYSTSKKFVDILSPNTGEIVGKVSAMTQEEVDQSIELAKLAQKDWSKVGVYERANLLNRWADELLKVKEDIAEMIVKEVGKTIKAASSEVERTVELIQFTAQEGIRMHGELMKGDSFPRGAKEKMAMIEKVPLGVILAISPFNYPINLAATKIAPALITGNTVVFKPATQGAVSALLMVKALVEAGLPKNVVNVITGKGSEIGDYTVSHPNLDMISFTGGTDTGLRISKLAKMIPVVLELGGKDSAFVLEDADLDKAATEIINGALSYSGQRCTAIKRVLVMESVADELVRKLEDKTNRLTVGCSTENVDITPLINEQSALYVESLIKDAVERGAKIIVGGKRSRNLVEPTLIDEVTEEMSIAINEQFGPVIPILRIKSIEEAIAMENRSTFGLQASIFTTDIKKAFQIGSEINVGTVQWNGRTERGPDHFPFLGVKASGLGVQGVRRSIETMVRDKVLVLNF